MTVLGEPAVSPTDYSAVAASVNALASYPTMTPEELAIAWMQAQAGTGLIPLNVFTSAEAATR